MTLQTDEPPQHNAGCAETEQYGPCAGCRWQQERALEWDALQRWYMLFHRVVRGICEGWGVG